MTPAFCFLTSKKLWCRQKNLLCNFPRFSEIESGRVFPPDSLDKIKSTLHHTPTRLTIEHKEQPAMATDRFYPNPYCGLRHGCDPSKVSRHHPYTMGDTAPPAPALCLVAICWLLGAQAFSAATTHDFCWIFDSSITEQKRTWGRSWACLPSSPGPAPPSMRMRYQDQDIKYTNTTSPIPHPTPQILVEMGVPVLQVLLKEIDPAQGDGQLS